MATLDEKVIAQEAAAQDLKGVDVVTNMKHLLQSRLCLLML